MKTGSFYIKTLCQTIEAEFETKHLEEILRLVKNIFKTKKIRLNDDSVVMQMPEDTNTLSREFYFRKRDS